MSFPEIVYRGKVTARNWVEGTFPGRSGHRHAASTLSWETKPSGMRTTFFWDPGEWDSPGLESQDRLASIRSEADALCEHRFTFLGLDRFYMGNPLKWHYNPVQKIEAPHKPAIRLDYRDPKQAGDVKYIWELNRHQHLPLLGLAFVLTREKRYAKEVQDQIRDWIEENPYPIGINWTSALEAALRLISWSWTFFLLRAGGEELPDSFFRSLGEHCRFVHRNFSLYSSRGNHLVGEASGLFMAALLFARDSERSRWMGDAYRILTTEIHELVHPEGSYIELSSGYHQFATDLFLLPALLGRMNRIEFPLPYWQRLEAMIRYLFETQDGKGWRPDLGDNDAGRCLVFEDPHYDNARSLLATGAILFEKPHYLQNIHRPDTKTLLLLGASADKRFSELKEKADASGRPPSRAFLEAGTYVLRTSEPAQEEIFLQFDAGPMGMEPMAGHGHADTLSFVLSIDGLPFFVDPGTYTYRAGDEWRGYFRGTSSHNTIRIDGMDLSASGGNFLWINKAMCSDIEWNAEDEAPFVRATHNGYERLEDPVLHTREIRLNPGTQWLVIRDEIQAKREHRVEIFFHLAPECELVSESDKGVHWIRRGEKKIGLALDARFTTRIARGQTEPILGWFSSWYGRKTPSYTITGEDTSAGSTTYETRILLKG